MTHRFHFNNDMYFVAVDEQAKRIQSVEIEGELPLLIVNAKHNTAGLWVLDPDRLDDYEIEPSKYYEETNEDGVTAVWHWADDNGCEAVRVVVFNSDDPENFPAQVIVNTEKSLFVFMTDFKDWVYTECYGNPVREMEAYCVDWRNKNYPQEGE